MTCILQHKLNKECVGEAAKTLIIGFWENKLISKSRNSRIFNIGFLNSLKNFFKLVRGQKMSSKVYAFLKIYINLGAHIFLRGWEDKLNASLLMLVCWCNKLPYTHKELQNNKGSYMLTKRFMKSRNNG